MQIYRRCIRNLRFDSRRTLAVSSFSKFSVEEHLTKMKPAITPQDEVDSEDEDVDDVFDDSMLEDPDPSLRIGKMLFQNGRSKARSAIPLPIWLSKKKDEICKYRTSSQIRRSLKNWMVEYDREYNKQFLDKPLEWSNSSSSESASKKAPVYGPDETVAYSNFFLSSRFGILSIIYTDMKKFLPHFSPSRVIDFGCGPGTAGAAALSVWENQVKKYVGIDMSKSMLEAAQLVMEGSGQKVGSVFWDKIGDAVRRAETRNERYELGVLSYTLSELGSDASMKAAVQIMFELLNVGGCLVIVEDGNPRGSHIVRTARQFLLDNFNGEVKRTLENKRKEEKKNYNKNQSNKIADRKRESLDLDDDTHHFEYILKPPEGHTYESMGASTISPCTHDRPCPLKHMFCSFTQKCRSGMIRKSNEEKYSYVVIQKVAVERSTVMDTNGKPRSVLDRVINASDPWLVPPPQNQFSLELSPDQRAEYRMLRREREYEMMKRQGLLNDEEEEEDDENYDENQEDDFDDEEDEEDYDDEDDNDNDEDKDTSKSNGSSKQNSELPSPRTILKGYINCQSMEEVKDLNDFLVDEIDWEEYTPSLHRQEWGRVIRSPLKNRGHIMVDSCTSKGFVTRTVFSKGNLTKIPSVYTALRKVNWGGIFPSDVDFEGEIASLMKIQDKANPLPTTYKFSKDYVRPAVLTKSAKSLKQDEMDMMMLKEETEEIKSALKEMDDFKSGKLPLMAGDEIGRKISRAPTSRRSRTSVKSSDLEDELLEDSSDDEDEALVQSKSRSSRKNRMNKGQKWRPIDELLLDDDDDDGDNDGGNDQESKTTKRRGRRGKV